jgi:hypothetical protein
MTVIASPLVELAAIVAIHANNDRTGQHGSLLGPRTGYSGTTER